MWLKKGDFELSTIGKLILAVAILILIAIIIYQSKGKMMNMIDHFKELLRFK